MRSYDVTVTEKVQHTYRVAARNGTEAAAHVAQFRSTGKLAPVSTAILDTRFSKPSIVTEAPTLLDGGPVEERASVGDDDEPTEFVIDSDGK